MVHVAIGIVGMSTTMKTHTSVPQEEEEEKNIMKEPEVSGLFTILVIFILVISILHFLCTLFFIINKLFKTNVRCKRGKTQSHKPIVRNKKLLNRTRRPLRSQFEMVNIQAESTDESDNDIFEVLHFV
jgi:hypothetical protein